MLKAQEGSDEAKTLLCKCEADQSRRGETDRKRNSECAECAERRDAGERRGGHDQRRSAGTLSRGPRDWFDAQSPPRIARRPFSAALPRPRGSASSPQPYMASTRRCATLFHDQNDESISKKLMERYRHEQSYYLSLCLNLSPTGFG